MADPVKHDTGSSMATAGWEAAKGGLKGAALVIGVGVVAGAAIGFGLIGGVGALIGGALIGGGVMAVAGSTFVGIAAAIGGLLGFAKGGDRVSSENAAYRDKVEHRAEKHHQKMVRKLNDAQTAGMQQGYQIGFQEGQQKIVHDIQEQMVAQAQEQQMQAPEGGFAAKFKKTTETKAELVSQQRETQAANPNQIG